MGRFIISFISILVCTSSALAEYRVFTLKIEDSKIGTARTVNTTLDHLQYHQYYPVSLNEVVTIQDTWMCRYYRSDISQDIEQKYCPNPKAARAPPQRS